MTITAKYAGTCRECGGRIEEGETVDWVRGEGTAHVECPTAPVRVDRQSHATPEELPVPQERTRAGRMLIAGQLDATVEMAPGQHVTIFMRALRRTQDGWDRVGLEDPGAKVRVASAKRGQRIGWIGEGYAIEWDRDVTDDVKNAVRYLHRAMANGGSTEFLPSQDEDGAGLYPKSAEEGWARIQVSSYCGRCGLELRDPVSIDRGIGPDCYGQMTGSKHATVKAPEKAPRPVRKGELRDGSRIEEARAEQAEADQGAVAPSKDAAAVYTELRDKAIELRRLGAETDAVVRAIRDAMGAGF